MKASRLSFAVAALTLLCQPASAAFVYENPVEFTAAGDFDGDGRPDVVIVDRASGTYRIGYQLSQGQFTWAAPRASGIDAVTGFSVGRIVSASMDALAFTAPEANRVNVFTAGNLAVAGLPVSLFSMAIGPSLVIALDIGGVNNTSVDDFVLGSVLNSGSPVVLEALRNQGTVLELLGSTHLPVAPRRGNAVMLKAGSPAFAALLLRSGANDLFKVYSLTGGALVEVISALVGPPFDLDYTFGFFNPSAATPQFLFYKPGSAGLILRAVQEPTSGAFTLAAGPVFNLGDSLRQVFTIPGTAAPRLLVIFNTGETARMYSFDGSSFPALLQTFTAPAGESFTGAAALAGGNVMLFSGPPGGSSANFRYYTVSGTTYTLQSAGSLPAVSALSRRANVMTFQFEPFVASAPNLLQSFNAGDWSSLYVGQPGSQANVTFESFVNPQAGLGSPVTQTLSPINTMAQFSLVNQYREPISLFRLTPAVGSEVADANILPAPGTYKTSVQVSFNTANPQTRVLYRTHPEAAWTLFIAPFWVFQNTTVSFYAAPTAFTTPLKSVIRHASYHITEPPAELDSDGDGVPDYVEIAKDLDPASGADADGDGYSDLDELINGTNPASPTSVPTGEPRQDLHGAVDLVQAPRAVDAISGLAASCVTGTALRAFALTGDLLSFGQASNIPLPQLTGPAAVLSNVVVDVGMKLLTVATDPHFDIVTAQADKRIGRELLRLLDTTSFVDEVTLPSTWAGGSLNAEADIWINSASNLLSTVTRKLVAGNFGAYDTLAALLVEAKVRAVLLSRGENTFSNLTLFPFRKADVGRPFLGPADLAALEQQAGSLPGFQLRYLLAATGTALAGSPPSDPAQQLKALAWEIYRVSSASNNIPQGASTWPLYPSPVDTLRIFLQTGVLHSNYLAASSTLSGLTTPAFSQAQAVLNGLNGRPVVTLNLKVRPDTFQTGCVLLDTFDGTQTRNLVNSAGAPFEFLDAFKLPTGTVLTVTGYNDAANPSCAGAALEVISVVLFGPPEFTSTDSDGDLLLDALELLLFGNLDQDAFSDFDQDGFSNLQEIFDQTDATDMTSKGVQAVDFFLPAVQFQAAPGAQTKLQFQWPSDYANKVQFNLYGGASLATPLTQLSAAPAYLGNDVFEFTFPQPASSTFFYKITVSLK